MLEEKLQNLVKEYPKYSQIFEAIFTWFENNPNQRAITMDYFYTNKYGFSMRDLNISFMILKEKEVLRTIYRILDDHGSKIGRDFTSIEEIPRILSTMHGDKVEIDYSMIVPYYALQNSTVI
ncbi:hypothetical protein SAMN04488033_1417 [Salegentibacter agarivorans]|uniref:Uncharacterized protein n=1 Tax=Salegentibacter agarivorans TaxID=345907 RepID=A0A1I2Q9T3_9FLAO|nr:hypothetical protein [Salegentibacter agarivorans]SFG22536.1 hypothetical protein SAMN04488033_1417 [Salegentibacter agarivorans]